MTAHPASAASSLDGLVALRSLWRVLGAVGSALLPFALFLLAWFGIKGVFDLPDDVLVSPAETFSTLGDLITAGVIGEYLAVSMGRLLKAAILSILIGVPIGLALGASRVTAFLGIQFVTFLLGFSPVALIPLFVLWFGLSETSLLVVMLFTAVLPITIGTMRGVQEIPGRYREASQTLGASRLQRIRTVYVPGAAQSMLVSIRIGIGYCWRALIAGEMLLGLGGLGSLIFDARLDREIGVITAGMVVIGASYLTFDRLLLRPAEMLVVRSRGAT